MVTHLLGWPGQLSACSSDSIAPFVFFSFFTSASTAFFYSVLPTLEKIFRLGAAKNLGHFGKKILPFTKGVSPKVTFSR
jgi:hypothetical protein